MTTDAHGDAQAPRVLTRVRNEAESGIVVAALEQEGIQAETFGEFTSGFRAEAPGDVKILVRSEDFVRAEQILNELRDDQTPIDWSKIDVGKPEEGTAESTRTAEDTAAAE